MREDRKVPSMENQNFDPLDPGRLRQEFRRQIKLRRNLVIFLRIGVGICLLGLWELVSRYLIDPFWISRPTHIVTRLWEWYFTGFFFPHLGATMLEIGVGFFIGLALAIMASLLLGTRKELAQVLDPFMMAIWSVPGIVLGPLFILYFGIGFTAKIVLVAVTVFFLIFFNSFNGIREVDQEWIDVLYIMGAKQRSIFIKVILPASALWIFSSFKNAIPYSLVAAVVGELIASQRGIGYLIQDASGVMDTTGVFAALFNLMLVGLFLNEVVEQAEKRILHWRASRQ
jgi:NitT/TauT family transport system permease protein